MARVTAAVDAAYDDEQAVEAAARRVTALVQGHAHRAEMYARAVDTLCDALKEFGDLGSWATSVSNQAADAAEEANAIAALKRASANALSDSAE